VATRSITTIRPAVHCDVCGRNLLRGEQPDVFLAGGERRMVCALCLGRAAHEGWRREGEEDPVSVRPQRGRGRSLRGRLRQRRDQRAPGQSEPDLDGEYLEVDPEYYESEAEYDHEQSVGDHAESAPARGESYVEPTVAPAPRAPAQTPPRSPRAVHAVPTSAEVKAARALEVFNVSDFPRRVGGVARSLGLPWVTARALTPSGAVVSIVVAWELCWYRYEVDLSDEGAGARQVEQGLELEELPEEDRVANAAANERGELRMLAA
jgi:hypothetical protein